MIIVLSIVVGVYSLVRIFNSSNEFKESFNEFETPSEIKIDLETGVYDLFELSTKPNFEKEKGIDYLIVEKGKEHKIIEIILDTLSTRNKSTFEYTILGKRFKSIGQFELFEKQSVTIISKINDKRVDKLAYRVKKQKNSFWGVMKFSLLLLVSIIGFLVSGILLLLRRNKK